MENNYPKPACKLKKILVVLIKPSKYDDQGYVIRFWKGVLPSNTLNVLRGLTEDVSERRVFGDLKVEIATFDETAEKVPLKKIIRWSRRRGTRVLVGLVGVQTNQFPRALDLGRTFRAHGIDVIIGGFHTSGTIAMLGSEEPDIQELFRESISVVAGEVEDKWEGVLADFVRGELRPLYSFGQDLQNLIDIENVPLPRISPKTMKHFASPRFGTVDTSRGCPFACTFCTIINVQGRKMRERSPEAIAKLLRRNYLKHRIHFYFFTDDNFARKKLWRETFEAIIRLREEGIKVQFMMQVDLARKPKDFVALAAKAGCTQVFIGMESVNPENLKAEGKGQNHVEEYREIIREWHEAGIVVHTGYIIGLPFDTKEQVPKDIKFLMDEIRPDEASFFMLTPLPGSHDHREMRKRGEWMDPDFNKRDSFHATIKHPHMTAEEWTQVYEDAWKTFYSKENMTRVLARWKHNPKVYWNIISLYIWYKNAALIEKQHPMIAGFFRLKDRLSRRPGFPIERLPAHLYKRAKEIYHLLRSWLRFLKEMEEIWLATRMRSEKEERFFQEIQRIQTEVWQSLNIYALQAAFNKIKERFPTRVRSLVEPFEELSSKILLSRRDLDRFLEKWKVFQTKVQEIQPLIAKGEETIGRWLEEIQRIPKDVLQTIQVQQWRESYARLRRFLPAKFYLPNMKFDAISNQVIYTRQDLQAFWNKTAEQIRNKRLWTINPIRLATTLIKDFFLTTSFAFKVLSSRPE